MLLFLQDPAFLQHLVCLELYFLILSPGHTEVKTSCSWPGSTQIIYSMPCNLWHELMATWMWQTACYTVPKKYEWQS